MVFINIKTTEITSNKEPKYMYNTMFAIIAGSMSLGYWRKKEMLSS